MVVIDCYDSVSNILGLLIYFRITVYIRPIDLLLKVQHLKIYSIKFKKTLFIIV